MNSLSHLHTPLIVGAGPVGLAAAVFLARQGVYPRLIDAQPAASVHSKALVVNPRTLELLEPTGVTEKMLAIGKRIQHMHLWHNEKLLVRASFRHLPHKYPFMLALSQAQTERLLTEALQHYGGHIDRETLIHCQQSGIAVAATIENLSSKEKQNLAPSWLLAADGARSTVRQQLGIDFAGANLKNEWYLADTALDTSFQEDSAHISFFDDGAFLFMLRVVDEVQEKRAAAPLWRIIANKPDLLSRLPSANMVGEPLWQSQFHIGHRIATPMQLGNVFLAGDAAHIHSPMGARGMNLGIEDAWTFSKLLQAGRLQQYGELRHAVDKRVVKRVELLTHIVNGDSGTSRFLRMHILPKLFTLPFIFKKMSGTLTGLDHPLPILNA